MNEVATATVQQVCDLAFYKRRDRWVDSRLVTSAGRGPAPRESSRSAPRVPRSGRQAGARGAPGEHRAARRHPDARRRPARPDQGARRSNRDRVVIRTVCSFLIYGGNPMKRFAAFATCLAIAARA